MSSTRASLRYVHGVCVCVEGGKVASFPVLVIRTASDDSCGGGHWLGGRKV